MNAKSHGNPKPVAAFKVKVVKSISEKFDGKFYPDDESI